MAMAASPFPRSIPPQQLSLATHTSINGEDEYDEDEHEHEHEHLLQIPSDTSFAKISVKDLKRYTDAGALILSGVSLDIHAGTIVGIIGPSGSGKSTLLRAFNRLWEPPEDSVFIDGEDITKLNVLSVRRRIGMLFQLPALFDGTVADNVNYGPSLKGEKLSDSKIVELLKLADLDPSFAPKSVIGLSVGQAQRVALARTLANDPEVLLLDEPTSALDPLSTQNIEESIMNLRRLKDMSIYDAQPFDGEASTSNTGQEEVSTFQMEHHTSLGSINIANEEGIEADDAVVDAFELDEFSSRRGNVRSTFGRDHSLVHYLGKVAERIVVFHGKFSPRSPSELLKCKALLRAI